MRVLRRVGRGSWIWMRSFMGSSFFLRNLLVAVVGTRLMRVVVVVVVVVVVA